LVLLLVLLTGAFFVIIIVGAGLVFSTFHPA